MSFLYRYFLLLAIALPVPVFAGGSGDGLVALLFSDGEDARHEILDPDVAFKVGLDQVANNQLSLNWSIEPGYYLYKDKFSIKSISPSVDIHTVEYPAGTLKQDPLFGEVEVYYGQDRALIPVSVTDPSLTTTVLEVAYQGCKEDSVCYPPMKRMLSVTLTTDGKSATGRSGAKAVPLLSEQDSITRQLKDKNVLVNVLAFFGFGLLLALTPCIFPMIPILSGILVGEGQRITRMRAFLLSISYVLAMALAYAVLGILAGMFNLNLQTASQNIWVLTLFSGIFVLLALSMFGFYELQLPSGWRSTLSTTASGQRGTLRSAAIMGMLSAVIVGPCIAPPLAGALLYISQTGDAFLGGMALFAMGLGLGVPLLVVGVTSGELLPRAGAWMETIKHVFGVIMLGVAIWFLERVLPPSITLLLWAALFITTAIFIGAMDRLEAGATRGKRLCKGLGLVVLIYGIVLVVAAARGNGTLLQPFNATSHSVTKQSALPFDNLSSLAELQQRLEQAKNNGQSVMLNFYADWCVVCHELENDTFSDPLVRSTLSQLVLLQIDVTENDAASQALLKHFDLFGPPAILFFSKDAAEIESHRLIGFINADDFVAHINQAITL